MYLKIISKAHVSLSLLSFMPEAEILYVIKNTGLALFLKGPLVLSTMGMLAWHVTKHSL